MPHIVAYTKYGRAAASTRQRILQYEGPLKTAGYSLEYRPLLSDDYVHHLTGKGGLRPGAIASTYAHRLIDVLARPPEADILWVYAEMFPWLPSGFERLIHRHRIPVVYDLDDAFFSPYDQHRSLLVRSLLKHKLRPLIQGAAATTCGNELLRDYVSTWCSHNLIVPTVVDCDRYLPNTAKPGSPVIGWIGSPSTWANVRPLLPLLEKLHRNTGARIRAVGAGSAATSDWFEGLELVEWTEDTEISEVQGFTIGIMPLADTSFNRGKCGYKLIQYMACAVPTVSSPVGANATIVVDGQTGFNAVSEAEWQDTLLCLLSDAALRAKFGGAGRERAMSRYSLSSQTRRLVELFDNVLK